MNFSRTKLHLLLICGTIVLISGVAGIGYADADLPSGLRLAPLNPEYVAYLDEVRTFSEDGHALGYVPPCVSLAHLKGMSPETGFQKYGNITRFDLRNTGKLTPVKDQAPWGTCWAFAAIGSLESGFRPNETFDFSEKNMVNRNLWMTGPDTGGNHLKSGGYLASWMGPIPESADPYPGNTWNNTSVTGPVTAHVQEILWIPERKNATDLDWIKEAIYNRGAIQSSFNYADSSYNSSTHAYYCPTCVITNHAIDLVGWDDSYSRLNFTTPAPGDGAFLLRNSWGPSWGDGGYGWISYHDPLIGKYNAQFIGSDPSRYTGIYQHDIAGYSSSVGYEVGKSIWGGNVFTATDNATLSAVGFYTNYLSAQYTAEVYKNLTNGPVGTELLSQQSGVIPVPGYHTISLNTSVPLMFGDEFSIVVGFINPDYKYPMGIQNPKNGPAGNNWTSEQGNSFVSGNHDNWIDLTEHFKNSSLCIKGFTESISLPTASFTANLTSGPTPLTVGFSDVSTGNPTCWSWMFGDGNISSFQHPVHTYYVPGSYTVSLNASNSAGSNMSSIPDYIQVSPTVTPTVTPTVSPTVTPTVTPTVSPTVTPTVTPTVSPTVTPTVTPTVSPTVTPTVTPTVSPTVTPTVTPTVSPTVTPTVTPTVSPTVTPTVTPTVSPTVTPTVTPTVSPTVTPTVTPTVSPTVTPTVTPTVSPTVTPTVTPTVSPTVTPTVTPTVSPTVTPTVTPTVSPTVTPTVTPTVSPTVTPTVTPTVSPTVTPTVTPTVSPTVTPTVTPTVSPTVTPTVTPTVSPTVTPTVTPTVSPTVTPTVTPTVSPTVTPTVTPTVSPTVTPTVTPTVSPTVTPTVTPTVSPTVTPTVTPTVSPTVTPTVTPTVSPTVTPTVTPTVSPTVTPTVTPTVSPTVTPTVTPTVSPTVTPTVTPTVSPYVSSITPDSGIQGSTTSFAISGRNFASPAVVNLSRPGQRNLTAVGVDVLSPERISGSFHLPGSADVGLWNLTVNQGNMFSNDNIQFQVCPSEPSTRKMNPAHFMDRIWPWHVTGYRMR